MEHDDFLDDDCFVDLVECPLDLDDLPDFSQYYDNFDDDILDVLPD
ncbi:MAG: hypothetical protein AABY32_01740 [Nanoarchaeota archaeon]